MLGCKAQTGIVQYEAVELLFCLSFLLVLSQHRSCYKDLIWHLHKRRYPHKHTHTRTKILHRKYPMEAQHDKPHYIALYIVKDFISKSRGCDMSYNKLMKHCKWRLPLMELISGGWQHDLAVYKQTSVPILFRVMEHVTYCGSVAHFSIFNSFLTTEVYGTEE